MQTPSFDSKIPIVAAPHFGAGDDPDRQPVVPATANAPSARTTTGRKRIRPVCGTPKTPATGNQLVGWPAVLAPTSTGTLMVALALRQTDTYAWRFESDDGRLTLVLTEEKIGELHFRRE